MFYPVRKKVFRWETPDPTGSSLLWGMLIGHLLIRESGCLFIDPPFVPGLVEAAKRIAKPEAVLLTTQNHTRGSRYIKEKTGIPVYLPDQNPGSLEPQEIIAVKEIGDYEVYTSGKVLGFEAFKFMEDYAILTDAKELIVGDNAVGDENGRVLVSPDLLPLNPPYPSEDAANKEFRDLSRAAFRDIVRKTGATSLLASHGYDIIETLQSQVDIT